MRIQQYEWSCGPAVVSNALRCFGIKVAENKIIPVAGTISPSNCSHCSKIKRTGIYPSDKYKDCLVGTDEHGVLSAIEHFAPNLLTQEFYCDSAEYAWSWLWGTIVLGSVVLLCVDSFHHWSLVLGAGGSSVVFFDPDRSKSNRYENGIFVLDKESLINRWHADVPENNFYAISVTQP